MLIALILGLTMGVIAGLVPSLGSASIMLIGLPLLLTMDPIHALYAYIALIVSSQYLGSVTAIYTGIPGTEASVPTAKEYPNIRLMDLTDVAIRQNATASVWGNVIGLGLLLTTMPILNDLLFLYKNTIRLGIVSVTLILIVVMSEYRLRAAISLALGIGLVSLGYDPQTFETHNLGLSILDNGFNWVVLLMGSVVGSALSKMRNIEIHPTRESSIRTTRIEKSVLRGSLVGFVAGMIPGLSYILSASLAYTVEKYFVSKDASDRQVLKPIAASEAAQSAGTVSMLIPFLLFSIPITASEGVIMNIVTVHEPLDTLFKELTSNLPLLLGYFFLVNIISYTLALSSKGLLRTVSRIPLRVMQFGLISSGILAVYMTSDFDLVFNLTSYFVLLGIFYYTRLDPLPFIMGVLLWPTFSTSIHFLETLS